MKKPQRSLILLLRLSGLLLLWLSIAGMKLRPGELVVQESFFYRAEGLRYQEAGDLENAAAAYRKAIMVNTKYADAYNDLGVVLESLGDLAGAEQAYESALTLNSNLGAAHSNLALFYERKGLLQQAAPHWDARIQLGPPTDPWVVKAREKLNRYHLSVSEPTDLLEKIGKEEAKKEQAQRAKAIAASLEFFAAPAASSGKSRVSGVSLEATKAKQMEKPMKPVLPRKAEAAPRPPPVMEEYKQQVTTGIQAFEEAKRTEAAREAEAFIQEKTMGKQTPPPVPSTTLIRSSSEEAQRIAESLAREKGRSRKDTARELIQRAVTATRQGRYEEAVVHYNEVLTLDPTHSEAREGLKRAQTALNKSKVVQPR